MITSLACICGGVGEFLILSAIGSGVVWLWRKIFRKGHKHGAGCKHEVGDGHH